MVNLTLALVKSDSFIVVTSGGVSGAGGPVCGCFCPWLPSVEPAKIIHMSVHGHGMAARSQPPSTLQAGANSMKGSFFIMQPKSGP